MRLVPITAAVAIGSVLLLTGCSGGGEGPTGGTSLNPTDSPLSAYFEKIGGNPEEQSAKAARSEEIVAQCMQEQGFEYTPADYGDLSAEVAQDDGPAWDSLEFAQQYGYGATTGDALAEQSGGDDGGSGFEDPNADYVAQMSETEQNAYYEALYGSSVTDVATAEPEEPADGDEESTEDEATAWDWTTAGCQGKAQHEVFEEGEVWNDPQFADLFEELSTLYEDSQSGEKVTAAKKAWSACMTEAGYDFAGPDDASQSIYDAQALIPFAEDGTQDPDALAELRKTEIATAVADRTCQTSTKYAETLLASQFELEQKFLDDHKAELDSLVASATKAAG